MLDTVEADSAQVHAAHAEPWVPHRSALWPLCLLILSALLPFAATRGYGHVHDDHELRGSQSLATDPRADLDDLWGADFFGTYEQPQGQTGFWRPLVILSFRLEAVLAGGSSQAYLWLGHVLTILCHLAATLALWRLLLALGVHGSVAVLAAALFGLAPVHVENVTWTSGRVDSLPTALAWGATALWLRAGGRGLPALAALLLFSLAPLGKETVVLLIALAPLAGRLMGLSWGRSLAVPCAALVATAVIRGLSFGFAHEIPDVAYTGPASELARWATWLSIQPDLLRFMFWPGPATPLHPVLAAEGLLQRDVLTGALLLGLLCVLGAWFVRRRAAASSYVLGVALGTLLMLAPWVRFPMGFPEVAGPLYERYLYVAVAAPALLLAQLLGRLVGSSIWRLSATMLALLVALAPLTADRARAWESDVSFARAGLAVAPGSANLWSHLGTALMEQYRERQQTAGRQPQGSERQVADQQLASLAQEAVVSFDRALTLDPQLTRAGVNRFITLVLMGRQEEAAGQATALLSRFPDDPLVLHNLGAWHEAEGRLLEAAVLFEQELLTDDPHPLAAQRLAALQAILLPDSPDQAASPVLPASPEADGKK